jgi:hypothetical protein
MVTHVMVIYFFWTETRIGPFMSSKNLLRYPVFRLLGHLLRVKRQKSLGATFFRLRGLESYGDLFWAISD